MSTWVIGDVQGCMAPLNRLLKAIEFDSSVDQVWFAGDLVNRGPDSLGVLRMVYALGSAGNTVLGNHDLYLLARAAGLPAEQNDTLDRVLAAPDADLLIDWLRYRPALHRFDQERALVHAGLNPQWSVLDALYHARLLERALRGANWHHEILGLYDGSASENLRAAARWLTRVRMVDTQGGFNTYFKGSPKDAPDGLVPWFEARMSDRPQILFGHWAALGHRIGAGYVALDSGCVWGGRLTAWCLETGQVISETC